MSMFNRESLFGKKEEGARSDVRGLTVTHAEPAKVESLRAPGGGHTDTTSSERERAAAAAAAKAKEDAAGSKLIVGPHIKLKGVEITDCDTLVVEGRVEASMDSRVVQIAAGGVFTGNATMDVAEIHGTFEGKLTARKQLVVYATGRVSGEIRYGRIRVEEGGELKGEVSTLGVSKQDEPAGENRPGSVAGKHLGKASA
jgi:cytoskeletal protein CcmA (bactofilin family)